MSDNLPTNVQLDTNQNGTVTFATEVVTTIAALAANEVEGVASMYGGSTGFADILSRKNQASKNLTKGVRVELVDGKINIMITIVIDYGSPVPEVARNIQENVKKAIETMAGLNVGHIDVHIQGLSFDKEQRANAEIEQQQRILLQRQQDSGAIGGERAPDAEPDEAPVEPEQPTPAEPEEDDDADFVLILDEEEEEIEPEEGDEPQNEEDED